MGDAAVAQLEAEWASLWQTADDIPFEALFAAAQQSNMAPITASMVEDALGSFPKKTGTGVDGWNPRL
eukprot:5189548-Prorocentrum_lima.AAC.1